MSAIASGAAFVFFAAASVSAFAQVQYSYDPNGRLVQVTMPNGASANYTYDADGNILSISNNAASAMSITSMAPQSGSVGTAVTLQGTGFSPTAANNTVQFNGTTAVITAATATTLQTTVPSGATSGTVSVSNSQGTAVAPTAFTVVSNVAPSISQFTPVIAAEGAAVTLTGSGFNTTLANDIVSFGSISTSIKSATATTLVAYVPTQSSSGKISVSTPGGQAVSTADFFAVPNAVTPANVTTKIRIVPSAAAQTITLASSTKAALMIFDAVAGQKYYFSSSAGTTNVVLAVYSPTGEIVSNSLTASQTNFSNNALPVTGTYTALMTASGSAHMKYQLLPGPADLTGVLPTDGSSISFKLAADQGAAYTFSGNAGQLVDIQTTKTSYSSVGLPRMYVADSEGNVIADGSNSWYGPSTLHVPALPVTGTYTVRFSPLDLGTSAASVNMITAPPPVNGTFTVDAPAQTLQLRQYQSANFTFQGTAGQRLYIEPSQSTFSAQLGIVITAPDQSQTLATELIGQDPEADDLAVLPVTGTYTVALNTTDDSAGSMMLALNTKPADQAVTATVNGSATQLSLAFDQDGQVSFAGTKNQTLWIQPTGDTLASCVQAVLSDAGGTVITVTSFCDTSADKNDLLVPLPASASYGIHMVRLGDPSAGSATFNLKTIPANKTGTIAINGASATVTLGVHQSGQYTMNGTSGAVVTLATSGQTLDSATSFEVDDPSGNEVDFWIPNSPSDTHTLPALPVTGSYVVQIVPQTTAAGKVVVKATQ